MSASEVGHQLTSPDLNYSGGSSELVEDWFRKWVIMVSMAIRNSISLVENSDTAKLS